MWGWTVRPRSFHTAAATAAHVSDVAILPDLLHGEETRVWGDGAYQGQREVIHNPDLTFVTC